MLHSMMLRLRRRAQATTAEVDLQAMQLGLELTGISTLRVHKLGKPLGLSCESLRDMMDVQGSGAKCTMMT